MFKGNTSIVHHAGVLQVEAMAQLGGIIMMDPNRDMSEQQNFFFGGIDSCKFRRPVIPGDTLVGFLRYCFCRWTLLYGRESAQVQRQFNDVYVSYYYVQMMKVELTKFNSRFGVAKVSGKAYVGPDLACEADLTLVLAK